MKQAEELAKCLEDTYKVVPKNGATFENVIKTKVALMLAEDSPFKVWLEKQMAPKPTQLPINYISTPVRFVQPLADQNKGQGVEGGIVVVPKAVIPTVQQPTSPEVTQAIARVQEIVKKAQRVLQPPEEDAPVSAGHVLSEGECSPSFELEEVPVVQLNTQPAAHVAKQVSSPVSVFNDLNKTEEELSNTDAIMEDVKENCPPAQVTRRMEIIPEVPEEFDDFDDGTTVDEEEEPVEEVAPTIPSAMVVHSATGDKMVGQPRKPTWMVDHLLPRSAFVALGKDKQPPLAVVSLGHITPTDLNYFAAGFFNSVKRGELSVVLVDTHTPDAILAVQTGGGQLYLALVKKELSALPSSATTTGKMSQLHAAKWQKQLQHGVSPQLVEDFVAALQQLSIRPEGHGSVFSLKKNGGHIGGIPQKYVRFADETTEFAEQSADKDATRLALPASDGETTIFSTFVSGSVNIPSLPTCGGGNTQPASFEASPLIAPLGAGSVFRLGSSDGSPDELVGQGNDKKHRVTFGIRGLIPDPEKLCDKTDSEGFGSDSVVSDAAISGEEDKDTSLTLGADAQFFAHTLISPTGDGSVIERAGFEQPSHQPDDDGYSSEDSEGSSTVENWFGDGSVSGDRDGSPTGYGRLEDDDPGVASPVGDMPSAFVPIGWSDRRGSSFVADLMVDGFLQSCASCATDWERSQMDGFPMSQGYWEEGLTLVC